MVFRRLSLHKPYKIVNRCAGAGSICAPGRNPPSKTPGWSASSAQSAQETSRNNS